MIGVFARMFSSSNRVTEVRELDAGVEVGARRDGGVESKSVIADEPPVAFSEKLETEGGTVYVVPFIEAFRAWLSKRRAADEEGEGRARGRVP